jgi:NADPH2:quinone reductase
MRAAYIEKIGPPDSIRVGELPDPKPTGAQVLVRVGAASVNPIDTYVRSGAAPMPLPSPYIVGSDLAGVVEAVGPDAKQFQVGDRVWGANQGVLGRQGTFSELAAIDEQWLYPTPASIANETAAAFALVGITVHLGLVDRAHLQAGETIVVSGGSGAVGSSVIQVAKLLGAQVIATTSSAEKADYCRSLGADHVLDYRTDDVPARVKEIVPDGANVWWETSREPDFDKIVGSFGRLGRAVLMAGRAARPEFPVGPFYVNCHTLYGFAMFLMPADAQRLAAEDINRWLAAGDIKPAIDRVAKLDDAPELHRLQEDNTLQGAGVVRGKLVVKL